MTKKSTRKSSSKSNTTNSGNMDLQTSPIACKETLFKVLHTQYGKAAQVVQCGIDNVVDALAIFTRASEPPYREGRLIGLVQLLAYASEGGEGLLLRQCQIEYIEKPELTIA